MVHAKTSCVRDLEEHAHRQRVSLTQERLGSVGLQGAGRTFQTLQAAAADALEALAAAAPPSPVTFPRLQVELSGEPIHSPSKDAWADALQAAHKLLKSESARCSPKYCVCSNCSGNVLEDSQLQVRDNHYC